MVAMVKSRSSIAGGSAARQGDVRDVHRGADLEAGELHDDLVGDLGRVDDQLDLVLHDVEHAAALDAGRTLFILEADRDVDVHLAVLADAQEVGMQRTVGDRVELHVLRQRADRLAAQLDHHDGIHEVAGAELADEELLLDVDALRLLTSAVDHGGNAAFAAQMTGGSLASPIARLGRQSKLIAHNMSPSVCVAFTAGPQGMTPDVKREALQAMPEKGKVAEELPQVPRVREGRATREG